MSTQSAIRRGLCAFAAAILLTACASPPVSFRSGPANMRSGAQGRPLISRSCGFQLLFLIPVGLNSRQPRAYRTLQLQAAGELVRQVSLRESWSWTPIGTVYCSEFAGYAFPQS